MAYKGYFITDEMFERLCSKFHTLQTTDDLGTRMTTEVEMYFLLLKIETFCEYEMPRKRPALPPVQLILSL